MPGERGRSPSEVVFRAVIAVMATLAVVLVLLLPAQEPGSGARLITYASLAIQLSLIAISLAGIYYQWDPFGTLFEP